MYSFSNVDKPFYFYLISRLLKDRFKRLRSLVQGEVEQMSNTILAACVLHNICIIAADDLTFEDFDVENMDGPQARDVNAIFADRVRERGS